MFHMAKISWCGIMTAPLDRWAHRSVTHQSPFSAPSPRQLHLLRYCLSMLILECAIPERILFPLSYWSWVTPSYWLRSLRRGHAISGRCWKRTLQGLSPASLLTPHALSWWSHTAQVRAPSNAHFQSQTLTCALDLCIQSPTLGSAFISSSGIWGQWEYFSTIWLSWELYKQLLTHMESFEESLALL